jgi:hypothetical protein
MILRLKFASVTNFSLVSGTFIRDANNSKDAPIGGNFISKRAAGTPTLAGTPARAGTPETLETPVKL